MKWDCKKRSLFLAVALTLRPLPAAAAEEPMVRVALLQGAESARLTIQAPCRVSDLRSGKELARWPTLKWQEARASESGVRIGPAEFASAAVVLEPTKPNVLIRVNAQPYRGRLILRRGPDGKLMVVDWLPLEDYLVGALTSETSSRWPLEALKAHAVVSRTMVAHRIWIRKSEPYDVTADVSTHVYHGAAAERATTRQAVNETRGQVLAYGGELFSASFHANCGGYTEDAAELWSVKEEMPPLKGGPDPYCEGLKHYRWEADVGRTEWERTLGTTAQQVGTLEDAEVVERNRSGRVRTILLKGSRGSVTLTGRRLREMLGANLLRSLKFDVSVAPGKIHFSGLGWGHGVGMCQWGAYGMAHEGHKMEEILSAYFPGADRRRLKGLPGFS